MKVLRQSTTGTHPLYELDVKDRKLLYVLTKNARIPITRIAQFVGISRDAVNYRIERLEAAEVLAGSRALINLKKLGYQSYHLFFSLRAPTKKMEDEFIAYLCAHPFVNAVIRYSGKWDFEIAIVVKDVQQLSDTLKEMLTKANVQEYEILPILRTYKSTVFPERFIKGLDLKIVYKKNDNSFYKDFEQARQKQLPYVPDDADLRLMGVLAEETQLPIKDIASKVGLSDDTVVYRVRKLIHAGYILEFRPIVNFSALGISIQAVLLSMSLEKKDEQPFIGYLKEHENVLWAVEMLGRWNVLIYIMSNSPDEFHSTMYALRQRFGELIKHYEVLFAYEQHKYTYFPKGLLGSKEK